MRILLSILLVVGLGVLAVPTATGAALQKGQAAPDLQTVDLNGKTVDLDAIVGQETKPYLVILFFFSLEGSEGIAHKLEQLNMRYGDEKIKIVALGMWEERAALSAFAERLGIHYHIIDSNAMKNAAWLKEIDSLPMTVFVQANQEKTIERIITGGGSSRAAILKQVAENLYQQRCEEALAIADQAVESGETEARELKGFILVSSGKLEEAEKEFGAIDSKTGLASVALERGDYAQASALATEAGEDGYAQTIKGKALLHEGKIEEASSTLSAAAKLPAADWQRSETQNAQGRAQQELGNSAEAIQQYEKAIALDPYNVVALSNESAVLRDSGKLQEAEQTLERAASLRSDDMTTLMLEQVRKEIEQANDIQRGELIRSQITDLAARYKELQASGAQENKDDWTSRPLVMAFLPSTAAKSVFFERAGADIVVQREIESRLGADPRVSVVERQMLDKLLQELQLGSSDLSSADTQRRLGALLSAGYLGFLDYARVGKDLTLYLRVVDTETTAISLQESFVLREIQPASTVSGAVNAVLQGLAQKEALQGLIADAENTEAILINLGSKHGLKPGQIFNALEEGDPIEVGGRVIAYRQRPVAKLSVSTVETDYAVCKLDSIRDKVVLKKEMKIKAAQ